MVNEKDLLGKYLDDLIEKCESVIATLNTDKKIHFSGNTRKGDPVNWEADISDLKQWGYSPKISLEEGIGLYISWIKNLI